MNSGIQRKIGSALWIGKQFAKNMRAKPFALPSVLLIKNQLKMVLQDDGRLKYFLTQSFDDPLDDRKEVKAYCSISLGLGAREFIDPCE